MTVERLEVRPTQEARERASRRAPADRREFLDGLMGCWGEIGKLQSGLDALSTPEMKAFEAALVFDRMRAVITNYFLGQYNGSPVANLQLATELSEHLRAEREYAKKYFGIDDLPDVVFHLDY
jgi:hypothetical protein